MNDEYNDGFDRDTYLEQRARRNFVPAQAAPLARREPVTIDAVPTWLATSQVVDIAAALEAQPASQERTSAVDRARGLQMRLWPFLLLYGAAGVVVGLGVWLVAGNWPTGALLGALLFAALGVGTYIKLNVIDYQHSGAGVERHRIDTAAQLQLAEQEHRARMQERMLDTHLRILERQGRE